MFGAFEAGVGGNVAGGSGSSLKDSESPGLEGKTNIMALGIFSFPVVCQKSHLSQKEAV